MNTYLVWTEQINQQLIEVKANSREEAVHKAQKIARPALEDMRVADVRKLEIEEKP